MIAARVRLMCSRRCCGACEGGKHELACFYSPEGKPYWAIGRENLQVFRGQFYGTVIRTDNYNILVLRSDLEDGVKVKCIRKFLDIKELHLVQSNITAETKKGMVYKRFLGNETLPKNRLDMMPNSKYTRHFFSDNE